MARTHFNGDDAVPIRPTRTRRPAGIARQAALPPMLPPRLIHRDAAAAYVGLSPNTFDKLIVEGLMPAPRRLSERRLAWDVRQLDAAIDLLPIDGVAEANDATDNSWADIDAQTQAKPSAH
jgi:predicted DNA-binding transcriptional regulator AlpA